MKESTKKKIIKTAKIAGMVVTAFFAVLGVVFSAAALNKCSGGKDERVLVTTKTPSMAFKLDESNPLVKNFYRGANLTNYTSTSLTFGYNVNRGVVELELNSPVYVTIYEEKVHLIDISGEEEIAHLNLVLERATNLESGTITCPELTSLHLSNPQYTTLLITPVEGHRYYLSDSLWALSQVTFIDLYNDPPIMSVNWGFQWFPWQMMGYAGSNPVILSDITGSIEDVHVIEHRYLDGFYFRSNGKLYKKIDIMYSWASGSELTDGSGKFYTVSNDKAWYIQEVRYYFGDGADDYDVVARFSVFESPENHYNIPAYGPLSWVAPAFRQIDIVYILNENALITTNTGSYTLSQWIEILLQPMSGDININVIQGGDPFSLMTSAFDSLKGIFSIAVLPGISLGLLLFLPIIAGIIVIILRVVKR